MLRRAALVHDVGMIGVPSAVWDEPKPWSLSQRERARTHPYLLERMLARTPLLAPDRALRGAAPRAARRFRVSARRARRDDPAAGTHPRRRRRAPTRSASRGRTGPPSTPRTIAEMLRDEARAGRLDGDVVNAVLRAGGQRVRRRPELPGGLTRREAAVLVSLARGRSNPEIAEDLSISRKTVSSHLEHIYTKLGISTRTEAALFAMQHGLHRAATRVRLTQRSGSRPMASPADGAVQLEHDEPAENRWPRGASTTATIRSRCSSRSARCGPVHAVTLADGHDAWLVVGHAEAHGRAQRSAHLEGHARRARAAPATSWPRDSRARRFARHMLAVDPPDHTRLAPAGRGGLRGPAVEALRRRRCRAIVDDMLDAIEARGPDDSRRPRRGVRVPAAVHRHLRAARRSPVRVAPRSATRSPRCSHRRTDAGGVRATRRSRPTRSSPSSRELVDREATHTRTTRS